MLYDHISKQVREYWTLTEKYMNDVLHSAPMITHEMAIAHENALHNLRMIISEVNFEALKREEPL